VYIPTPLCSSRNAGAGGRIGSSSSSASNLTSASEESDLREIDSNPDPEDLDDEDEEKDVAYGESTDEPWFDSACVGVGDGYSGSGREGGRSSGGGALASQRVWEVPVKMEANVSSGVGGVSARAGGEVRGYVGFWNGLGDVDGSVSKSAWGWSRGGGVIDIFWGGVVWCEW
jgi:hypothetical protein